MYKDKEIHMYDTYGSVFPAANPVIVARFVNTLFFMQVTNMRIYKKLDGGMYVSNIGEKRYKLRNRKYPGDPP